MSETNFTPKEGKRARRDFTVGEVAERLTYEPESGLFRWRVRVMCFGGGRNPGDIAGTTKDGYTIIILFGRQYRAHHLAWLFMTGEWPPTDGDVDHENRSRSDNRWINLRLATRAQNNLNSPAKKGNTSGFKGVHRTRNKWFARIQHGGKIIHLGVFDTKELAAAARAEAERHYYGEFSSANQGTKP